MWRAGECNTTDIEIRRRYMLNRDSLRALLVVGFFVGFGAVCSGGRADAQALHIDVPVKLEKANVVVDVGNLVLNGDLPFVLGDLHFLAGDYSEDKTQGEIIAVFHGNAAYLVLNDDTYNADRHVQTGNPYGKLIMALMKQGVQIELCGATAAGNHWVNSNLLPGVKVNTDAMARVTELQQKGFTLIYQ
jgi:intracellular sulfur oxidation DsrE/DsrF family protein